MGLPDEGWLSLVSLQRRIAEIENALRGVHGALHLMELVELRQAKAHNALYKARAMAEGVPVERGRTISVTEAEALGLTGPVAKVTAHKLDSDGKGTATRQEPLD